MGFRFRRSIKLIPGVRLNLGKQSASLSLGGHGATVNLGQKGVRTTVGLPGSGMSYSSYQPYAKTGNVPSSTPAPTRPSAVQQHLSAAVPTSPSAPLRTTAKPWPASVRLVALGVCWAVALTGVSNGATWLLWTAFPFLGYATWRHVMRSSAP